MLTRKGKSDRREFFKEMHTLKEIRKAYRESPEWGDLSAEFVVDSNILIEAKRFRDMHYIVAGEDCILPDDEYTVRDEITLGKFAVAELDLDARPQTLKLRSDYQPSVDLFRSFCAFCELPGTIGSARPDWVWARAMAIRPPVRLTKELTSFVVMVQALLRDEFVELRQMSPRIFAALAMNRWLRLRIARLRSDRYHIAKQLASAPPREVGLTAVILASPYFRCDPTTLNWSVRPGFEYLYDEVDCDAPFEE